jgi:uncharacterized protein YukE
VSAKTIQALKDEALTLTQNNDQLNFYKSNLASVASELTSYRERMEQLAVTHRKAVAGFASDWAKAESDTLNRISGIYERLSEQLSEMAESASERRADAERDWLRAAEGFARDRARIERELADDIAGIQRDAVTRESDAKTWSEVLRIRREAKAREEDARKKATTARDELATRERDALGEHNYREGLAERAAMKAAERARRDADRQAESARQAGQATLDAIAKRRDAEIEAYNQSALAAKKAHDARMRELLVTQTETEKLAAAWLIVRDNIDAATQALIVQSGVLRGVTGAGTTFPTWQSVYKHRGELVPHALGGSGTFPGVGTGERPYLISAQPGERYTITSKENAPGSTARGAMVFNNCTFRDTNDVLRALELYERGLV